jgi:hypothetical protein
VDPLENGSQFLKIHHVVEAAELRDCAVKCRREINAPSIAENELCLGRVLPCESKHFARPVNARHEETTAHEIGRELARSTTEIQDVSSRRDILQNERFQWRPEKLLWLSPVFVVDPS